MQGFSYQHETSHTKLSVVVILKAVVVHSTRLVQMCLGTGGAMWDWVAAIQKKQINQTYLKH